MKNRPKTTQEAVDELALALREFGRSLEDVVIPKMKKAVDALSKLRRKK